MKPSPPLHGGAETLESLLHPGEGENRFIDFSVSINPLGPPDGLKEFLVRRLRAISVYPEITAATLTDRIADCHGYSKDWVIVGNGTADLLFAFASLYERKKAVIPFPTFVEYERVCTVHHWEIEHVPPLEGESFSFDLEGIAKVMTDGAVAFLCQPNNPTGRGIDRAELEELLSSAEKVGGTVVVDEAFLPFSRIPSVIEWVRRWDRLVVLRSMTKSFAIPGLRLGYAVANPTLIERWKTFLPPWNVNTLAQLAGVFCLEYGKDYMERSRQYLVHERDWLMKEIQKLPWLSPFFSEANFFLLSVNAPTFTADEVYHALAKRGIVVRHCGSFRGMGNRYLRIGVKRREENRLLVSALRETLEDLDAGMALKR